MQTTPYTVPVLLAGLAVTAAGLFVLRRRARTPAAMEFLVVVGTMALTTFAYAVELSLTSLDAKLALLSVRYVGICATPAAGLVFALRWGGHHGWRTPVRAALLVGVPIVVLFLAWTNEWHHWVASPSTLVQHDGYTLRHAESRSGFWLLVLHSYGCLAVAAWVYLRAIYASPLHRTQAMILLVALFVPWTANAIYLGGQSPDPDLDVSAFGFAGASLIWAFGLSRARLFDIAPVARGQVFDGLVDAVLVVDAGGRVVDWNPAAAQLFGRRVEDGVGLAVRDLLGEEVAARVASGDRAELPLLGRMLALDTAALGGGRDAIATIVTLRDVSEQHVVQAAREEALRMAESVARVRSEFLARMSHEVRGPLHAVAGAADLLLGAELDAPARRYAEAVATSSRALLSVVDDLLDFSKLDADRLRVEPSNIDGLSAMHEVARIFAGAADKKHVRLAVEGEEPLPVRADPARLRQVLVNLVGNAIKFTDRGSIVLRARPTGALTRFEIADTGVGIPEHAHARIFEPFVQVGALDRAGPAGTGLGLAISRRLVSLMGGEMGVESRVGEGSTFWLALPTAGAITAGAAAQSPPRAVGGARRGRVLVVDDSEVNRFITCALLEREGCEVDGASDAQSALELLRSAPYALVLTDLRMPGTDGFELTAAIRRGTTAAAATPIVALTGDVVAGAELRARAAGMDDWLSKPVDPARLREIVDRFASEAAPSPPPMSVRELLASRPELYDRVMTAFRESTPRDLARIEEAAREERWAAMHDAAHALEGAARMVGAVELARVGQGLAGVGTLPEARLALLGELRPRYAAFLAEAARDTAERARAQNT